LPGDDLSLLLAAAEHAGRIALRYWRRSPETWNKGDDSPVTEADMAVNRMLQAELLAARPGYGWLSEETPDDAARLSCERVFVVDPIDGTRAFIAGETAFSHALAVVENGVPVAGVVHLPAQEVTFAAVAGGKATRNGQALACSAAVNPEGATALMSSAVLAAENWPGGVPGLRRHFRASLAWRFCLVADGSFDALLSVRPAWEWDIAAGALIAERAGAVVSDAAGQPMTFNRPTPQAAGVIVAGPPLHGALMARRLGHTLL
jgi:myo-inositol-1(or 4)-monophosphatase